MKGYYINLKHRKDRDENIKQLKNKYDFFKNIERFDAIYDTRYGVGCCSSHIECLKKCLNLNDEYYLILEDDLQITDEVVFEQFVINFEKIKNNNNWDVITLTPRGITKQKYFIDNFHRIINNQTATAYIIKHEFIKRLLPILQNGLIGLQNAKTRKESHPCCYDQCWKPIQQKTNWLYFHKIFATQKPGYSDIEKRNVNYNKRFFEQLKY